MASPNPPVIDPQPIPHRRGTFVPCATAFVASACVMIVELLAFRLVTRYLGSSNYTTTAIIGVVLGGLALGNYLGGVIADRYRSTSALASLFVLSSGGCFAIPMLNALVGEWSALWFLSWPVRIAIHVFLSFFIPCALLGTIGPVVAKMALERGRGIGRTVGGVYAWGVLGSLLGTFASGFFLIPRFGLFTINHVVAAILALMGVLFAGRRLLPYGWAAATCLLLVIIFGLPFGSQEVWAKSRDWAAHWGLRDYTGPDLLFDRASEYSQVRIETMPRKGGRRVMLLDNLAHSFFDPAHPDELQYGYERIFSAITTEYTRPTEEFRALVLGGGGFTHPRHLLLERPNARLDVVEIDPVVTEAARAAFGLSDNPRMEIFHLDARQHVMALNRSAAAGDGDARFKLIFLDAINDFIVPPHLTTQEFHQSVKRILAPDGAFLMILVDILDEGAFLGSVIKTLRSSFSQVDCYFSTDEALVGTLDPAERYTFVVVGSDAPPETSGWTGDVAKYMASHRVSDADIQTLLARPGVQLLTDDSAPVEAMLANLPIRSSRGDAAARFHNRGNRAADEATQAARSNLEEATSHYHEAVREYERALSIKPDFNLAQLNVGLAHVEESERYRSLIRNLVKTGQTDPAELDRLDQYVFQLQEQAVACFEGVIRIDPTFWEAYYDIAQVRVFQQRFEESLTLYNKCLEFSPDNVGARYGRALSLANVGRLADAKAAFEDVLERDPNYPTAREYLERLNQVIATSRPADAGD